MDMGLKGQVALVTGGGQGVGRRICLELADEGAWIVVNDLQSERAVRVASEISSQGGRAFPAACDITDAQAVDAMVQQAREHFGVPVTVLINNAGIIPERREQGGMPPTFVDTSLADWSKILRLNLDGSMNCCKAVLPGMVESMQGRIVNIISEAGRAGEERLAVYSGAKGGLAAFGRALAREHARHRITVNAVALGAVSHEGIRSGPLSPAATPDNDPVLAKMLKSYPIARGTGRLSRPEDISGLVAFLVSNRAQYITGQTIGASGGFVIT